MCGIFTMLNNSTFNRKCLKKHFESCQKIEDTTRQIVVKSLIPKVDIGYISNQECDGNSNKPIIINEVAILCNGEIYNSKELYSLIDVEPTTEYSCEIIIHLYIKYGIEYTLEVIRGVFSFLLVDFRIREKCAKLFIARDPFGVSPLYILKPTKTKPTNQPMEKIYAFAKNIKTLNDIVSENDEESQKYDINQFQPGSYSFFEFPTRILASWKLMRDEVKYYTLSISTPISIDMDKILKDIQDNLVNSVRHLCRHNNTDYFACLLSGGLNSSLVAALVNDYCKDNNLATLETYSIGLEGSNDLKYAKIVADYLGTNHTEIVLTEETLIAEFSETIPYIIYLIESCDVDCVREGIRKSLLAKHIYVNSDIKYIFCGDGLNEMTGCYLNEGNSSIEYDSICRSLLKDLHRSSTLYSEKGISMYGMHTLMPYLDSVFVQNYMMIHSNTRHYSHTTRDKYLIRMAFNDYFDRRRFETGQSPVVKSSLGQSPEEFNGINAEGGKLLPNEVLFREKETFSQNTGVNNKNITQIIEEYANSNIQDGFVGNKTEEQLYRFYFNRFFGLQ